MINDCNEVDCCLVTTKSRVTPLKPVFEPRLEFIAAVRSTKFRAFQEKKKLKYGMFPSSSGPAARSSKAIFPTVRDDSTHLLPTQFRPVAITSPLTSGTSLTLKIAQRTTHQDVWEPKN